MTNNYALARHDPLMPQDESGSHPVVVWHLWRRPDQEVWCLLIKVDGGFALTVSLDPNEPTGTMGEQCVHVVSIVRAADQIKQEFLGRGWRNAKPVPTSSRHPDAGLPGERSPHPEEAVANPKEVLSRIQAFPREEVQRAEATVLAGGPPPQTPQELERFHWLVLLLLTGAIHPEASPRRLPVGLWASIRGLLRPGLHRMRAPKSLGSHS